jgi:DnaK suppressor protein
MAKELATKEPAANETATKEKEPVAKEPAVKETVVKETVVKEAEAKEAREVKAPVKHAAKEGPGGEAPDGTADEVEGEAHKLKRARPAVAKKTDGTDGATSGAIEHGEPREEFLEHQRLLLLAERRNYTRQAEELRAQAEALALEHEPGDVQFDEEGGEGGTANVDRELDLHLSAQAQAAIEEIDAALDKITAKTYGFCESCGSPVPKARLEALPHARLCVSCKSGGLSARRQ